MIDKISDFIQEQGLCGPQHRLLAAVSGGIDSAVLCDALSRLGFFFAVAHCHFGLRGEEADADETFVKKLAKKYKVPFYSEHFRAREFAEAQKVSVQMAARTLRYAWFARIRQQEGYDFIVTAHHSNDTAETVLLNLTKGTGIAGFHGIPARNGSVIRPLLCLNKAEIQAYVAKRGLVWREDSSNTSIKYQRNLIRQEVIPLLKNINPNFERTLQQTVTKMQGVEAVFQAYVAQARQQALRQENDVAFMDIASLRQLTGLPVVLHEILRPFQFSYAVTAEVIASFQAISGKIFFSPTHVLVKDRDQLVLTPRSLTDYVNYRISKDQRILETGTFRLHLRQVPAEEHVLNKNPQIAALDAELLQFPLQLRKWQEGDWFMPLGMTGKKKLSDFLIDRKVPLNLKEQVLVLVSGQAVAWVVGFRPDNRFKITSQTRRVLEIRQEPIKTPTNQHR